MTDQQLLQRITCDPAVMVGKPVIKGTRLTVEYVLNLLTHGSTVEQIQDEYDGLEREDVQATTLLFAKFWLDPIELAKHLRFADHEVNGSNGSSRSTGSF